MGFVGFLEFAVKCFDVVAWPLFALGYPLFASILAVENDSISDTQKLVTYWVLFSLISLFDHAFMKLLQWLPFWPYLKLMVILWLIIPNFNKSLYVYEHFVRPCFSVNPSAVINQFNKRKEFSLKGEDFLVAAERYVKENGSKALEDLIAGELKHAKPALGVDEIKALASTEKPEVFVEEQLKYAKPELGVDEIKALASTEKAEVFAAEQLKGVNLDDKEIEVVASTTKKEVASADWFIQTEPIITQTEEGRFKTVEIKESANPAGGAVTTGTYRELPETPASTEVQKCWICSLCQVRVDNEITWNSHLQGRKHQSKTKNQESKNQGTSSASWGKKTDHTKQEPKKSPSSNGSSQKNTKTQAEKVHASGTNDQGNQKKPEKTAAEMKPPEVSGINEQDQRKNLKRTGVEEMEPPEVSANKTQWQQKNPKKTNVEKYPPQFWCSMCNIGCPSEWHMVSHLQGRKHRARIQEQTTVCTESCVDTTI